MNDCDESIELPSLSTSLSEVIDIRIWLWIKKQSSKDPFFLDRYWKIKIS